MRCPKCGYTSFDNLERCKKCKKNISAATAALMGTVAEAVPPAFLWLAEPQQQPDAEVESFDGTLDLDVNDDNTLDFGGTEDELFSLDGESKVAESVQLAPDLSEDDGGLDLHLNDDFEARPLNQDPALDIELDLGLEEDAVPASAHAGTMAPASHAGLDLAGLDISDLQAPQSQPAHYTEIEFEPALSLDDSSPSDPRLTAAPDVKNAAQDFSLEDLEVADLGVERNTVSETDARYQPSTKTGTALDSFNFELDELLEADENEKA